MTQWWILLDMLLRVTLEFPRKSFRLEPTLLPHVMYIKGITTHTNVFSISENNFLVSLTLEM